MEHTFMKAKYDLKLWLTVFVLFAFGIIELLIAIYTNEPVLWKLMLFICSAITIYVVLLIVLSLVSGITFNENIVVHRYFMKDKLIKKADIKSISSRRITTNERKSYAIGNIDKNRMVLESIVDFLELKNREEAIMALMRNEVIYMSKEILEKSQHDQDKHNRNLLITASVFIAITVIATIGSLIWKGFKEHWTYETAIIGFLILVIMIILAYFTHRILDMSSSRLFEALYWIVLIVFSFLLSFILTYAIYKIALHFGIDLKEYKL